MADEIDISREISIINTGRYGFDVRNAIHDALEKLSAAEPAKHGYTQVGQSFLSNPVVSRFKIATDIFPFADFSIPLNLVNGAWVTYVNQYATFQSRTNRVTMSVPCRLPAGKTITFSCPTSGIKLTAALMDTELLVLENISWSDTPLVATNSTGNDVSCIVGFKRSNDADFTPSYLGTVTFTIT